MRCPVHGLFTTRATSTATKLALRTKQLCSESAHNRRLRQPRGSAHTFFQGRPGQQNRGEYHAVHSALCVRITDYHTGQQVATTARCRPPPHHRRRRPAGWDDVRVSLYLISSHADISSSIVDVCRVPPPCVSRQRYPRRDSAFSYGDTPLTQQQSHQLGGYVARYKGRRFPQLSRSVVHSLKIIIHYFCSPALC